MARKAQQAPVSAGASILDADKLKAIYTAMLRLRALSQGRKPHSRGQVAVLAGVLSQLREDDAVIGVASELLATVSPVSSPHCVPATEDDLARMHITAGVALANKHQRRDSVAVFCTSGCSEKTTDAALKYAGDQMLPILYVAQPGPDDARKRTWKQTFPSIPVEIHDAIAVYRVAYESLKRARQGGGPTWMECKPWQVQSRSRDRADFPGESDPVVTMETYLAANGVSSAEW